MPDESSGFMVAQPHGDPKGTSASGERTGDAPAKGGRQPPPAPGGGKPAPGATKAAGERVSGTTPPAGDPPETATSAAAERVQSSIIPPGAGPMMAGTPGVPFAIAAPHHFPAGAPGR